MHVLALTALLLAVLLALLCGRLQARSRRLRRRLEEYRRRLRPERPRDWPVPLAELSALDPAFEEEGFGPTPAAEVHFVSTGVPGVPGGTTDREAWILGVLAKRATSLFEFGTCTGRTTYLLARNAPEDARVFTLTLAPEQTGDYAHAPEDAPIARQRALEESCYTKFYYTGTPVEPKIEQLFGDSKSFDETPHLERHDLVFVDGSHAYSYVRSDSEKALRMLRPGGTLVWHDYRGPDVEETLDVFRFLNELAERLPLIHLRATSLVAYRRPGLAGAER